MCFSEQIFYRKQSLGVSVNSMVLETTTKGKLLKGQLDPVPSEFLKVDTLQTFTAALNHSNTKCILPYCHSGNLLQWTVNVVPSHVDGASTNLNGLAQTLPITELCFFVLFCFYRSLVWDSSCFYSDNWLYDSCHRSFLEKSITTENGPATSPSVS